jgi:hypothetical protein
MLGYALAKADGKNIVTDGMMLPDGKGEVSAATLSFLATFSMS